MNKIAVFGVGALIAAAMAGNSAEARMSKAQVAQALEKAYPVQVLSKFTKLLDFGGKPAYEVKVMNQGGNFNEAFMITTLIVDADSGELLSVFQHRPSGYNLSDGGAREPNRQPTDSPRGVLWR